MTKQTYSAGELAELLGVSESLAYRYIRQMKAELAQKGYLTVRRRISRAYVKKDFSVLGSRSRERWQTDEVNLERSNVLEKFKDAMEIFKTMESKGAGQEYQMTLEGLKEYESELPFR